MVVLISLSASAFHCVEFYMLSHIVDHDNITAQICSLRITKSKYKVTG